MTRPARATWEHDGVRVLDGSIGDVRMLLVVRDRRTGLLMEEYARSLRDAITEWLGDGGHLPPADPCAVRVAVQEQQRLLLDRDLTGSDAATEAGWAQHALAEIARAAGAR